jgi:ribosomal protein S18 acetylase RimI-like enzyme
MSDAEVAPTIVGVCRAGPRLALRKAATSDADQLFDGYEATVGPYVQRIWGWDRHFQRRRFRERYALADFRVIERAGRFAGALHVERSAERIYLALIYVLPELQGRGIGGRLVRELIQEGRSTATPVALTVIDGNPARGLYERLGFKVIARDNHSSRMQWTPPRRVALARPLP